MGLGRDMSYSDARAFCPELHSRPADPRGDERFLKLLRRWATRYCPWVGLEGPDGLVLDITGAAHLMGGEAMLLSDIRQRLSRAGLSARLGLADTRGAAWALAHYGEGIAKPGDILNALADLPVAALRIDTKTDTALQRLGLRTIGALEATGRAPLNRRFGPTLLRRLDQALGREAEEITPMLDPPHYGTRLTFPEPIGLMKDVMDATERLLVSLCDKLLSNEAGARRLCLTLSRVDQENQEVELRLARPLRDAKRILPLFERGVSDIDAGFGIDQIRLFAAEVEPLPARQLNIARATAETRLDDLITRLGTRIGIENIQRFLPADSHIPERSYQIAAAAFSTPEQGWGNTRSRPLKLFPPEPMTGTTPHPPAHFRWRRMTLSTARATGPERILPEWWLEAEAWHRGMRDYWRIETRQGRRIWAFYTPQNPGWFVHGEFS